MDTKKFDIFLSYKSEDGALVERLKSNLLKRGVRVWLDKDQIRPGDLFHEALEDGIAKSRSVGLVVTPRSMASGWVNREKNRATSLATQGKLQLIPLLFEEAERPGFLGDLDYVDFRDESAYDRNVHRLIWPGITRKDIVAFAIHGSGGFPWGMLRQHLKEAGIDESRICSADYVEFAPDEIYRLLEEGNRVVVFVDIFEGRPSLEGITFRTPKTYVKSIFEIRDKTNGTRGEVVFVLYHHPQAFDAVSHGLGKAVVMRLQKYFTIPRTFDDSSHGAIIEEETENQKQTFIDIWFKVNRMMLHSDVRNDVDFKLE